MLTDEGLRERLRRDALEECRRTYGWSVVGREIMGAYDRLAGTAPDTAFAAELPLAPCRFREAPHLL